MRTNPEWSDFLVRRYSRAIKERWGDWAVPSGKEYGCGGYGCVFPTKKESYVVKITTDETEAKLIATFLHPNFEVPQEGIVEYKDMFVVLEKRERRHVFFILRKSAEKVGEVELSSSSKKLLSAFFVHASNVNELLKNKKLIPTESHIKSALEKELQWGEKQPPKAQALKIPPSKGKLAVAYNFAACKQLAKEMCKTESLYSVGVALGDLLEQGIVLADVHRGNIGYSYGEVVITDPGNPVFLKHHPTIDVPLIEAK